MSPDELMQEIRDGFLKSLADLEPSLRKHLQGDPDVPIHWALVIDWIHHEDFPNLTTGQGHRYAISSHAWPAEAPDSETIKLLKDGVRHFTKHGTRSKPSDEGNNGGPTPEAA